MPLHTQSLLIFRLIFAVVASGTSCHDRSYWSLGQRAASGTSILASGSSINKLNTKSASATGACKFAFTCWRIGCGGGAFGCGCGCGTMLLFPMFLKTSNARSGSNGLLMDCMISVLRSAAARRIICFKVAAWLHTTILSVISNTSEISKQSLLITCYKFMTRNVGIMHSYSLSMNTHSYRLYMTLARKHIHQRPSSVADGCNTLLITARHPWTSALTRKTPNCNIFISITAWIGACG